MSPLVAGRGNGQCKINNAPRELRSLKLPQAISDFIISLYVRKVWLRRFL